MKIIFDLRRVGLGNNGGSSTLIKSGNTLKELGHCVTFIDSMKNKHTWTPLEADHIIPKRDTDIPSADFIIATGYKSVATTLRSPGRLGHKCHWIRGWETWQMSESRIINEILNSTTIKLVNSICLQRKLAKLGYPSTIIRPGYDLDQLTPQNKRKNDVITLGGLYSARKHHKIKRTQWIFDVYTKLKKKHRIELWMFGNDAIPGGKVDFYMQCPNMQQKNYLYNNVDIWLSPAMQEGLHMPPAEAMMTGCPVVGTNADMSGTEDYLINNYNGLISDNNFQSFSTNVERLVTNENLRLELGRYTRTSIEDLGNRKINMKKLIDYFMGIIT